MDKKIKVTIWNEYRHEKTNEKVRSIYPQGMHMAIADGLGDEFDISTATLDLPEHGLTEELLNETDVLIWWGHKAHEEVNDNVVERVYQRVLEGMGLIILHSGHFSKIFKKLMGTSCDLKWRRAGEKERIWVVSPSHPIVKGIDTFIELKEEEMYGEHFDIPEPDELVLISWFEGGEVFRSGCCYKRGLGKIFYFRPGDEAYPTYYHDGVRTILRNGVRWASYEGGTHPTYGNVPTPLEPIKKG
ncbi:ThuA domain-containing protein [Bacillus timonensis]|uniref:ThuA domain-containing protein n=1 Tax=Bacillus timonensis TaxID=1033734 RepID=UPI0002898B5E|nr:trehalose utilization protein ThuA [Bacillus timonensis]